MVELIKNVDTSIEKMPLPDSLTKIESRTFLGCTSLFEITIPNGVTNIGSQAFQGCSNLTKVEMPTSLKEIGTSAFENCSSLTDIKIPEGVTVIESSTFDDCTSLKHVDLPGGLIGIGSFAFQNCSSLENPSIPDTVTDISDRAFLGCTSITEIIIPSSVTFLGYQSFFQCDGLSNIEILGGLDSIQYGAIYTCKNLKKVIVRDDIASIDTHTFRNCPDVIVYTAGENVLDFCKTRNIKCCPYIEEVYPEPNTEDLDNKSSNLVFYADFMCNIAYNDGFAYLFEEGNDTTPVEEIFLGEPDEGKCSIENGRRLILNFSRESLEKGKSYYIRIEQNALKLLDDENNELDKEYPGLEKEVWTFSTEGLFVPVEPSSVPANSKFLFRSNLKENESIKYTFNYNDEWVFSNNVNDRYKLMQTSIRVAMAAFGTYEDNGYGPANIKKMMDTMGFDYIDNSNETGLVNTTIEYPKPTKENENTIGFAIGMKNLKMLDGSTRSIILIAIRGGGYETEWGGNFHVGDNSVESTGFRLAAKQVESRLHLFFLNYKQYISDDLRIWITGYSRAGATSNLVATHLINGKICDGAVTVDGVSPDEVMAFCFECPETTTAKNANDSKYDNIINIVNPNDFVPKVPLTKWGFTRYGKTYYIPCIETASDYISRYYVPMNVQYKKLFDSNYIAYNVDVSEEEKGQASLLEDFFDFLGFFITRAGYNNYYEKRMVDIAGSCLGGQGDPDWGKAIPQMLSLLGIATFKPVTTAETVCLFTIGDPAPAPNAHYAEKCLSWIDSLNKFDDANYALSRKVHVNCPVNVTVRDSGGNIVGKIENDVVEEIENGIVARIDEDGQKVFFLPQDEEYTIDIKATDDGEVNYTVQEYNFDSHATEKVVSYKNIEVSAGDELLGTATEIPEDDEAEYTLKHADNQAVITPDDILIGNEVVEYAVETSSDGNGTVTGGGSYIIGEFAQVTATADEGYEFDGWYSGDKCVSKEAEYRFAVEADTVLKAAFTPVVESISIENAVISGIGNKTYTGEAAVQNITVKYNGTVLVEKTDYTLSYENNTNVGTASVIITGIGTYTGKTEKTFEIKPKPVAPTITLSETSFVYNGEEQKPEVTVKDGKTVLSASDYTVTWSSGCTDVGTYRVSIDLKGNYSGSGTADYKITEKKVTLGKTTRGDMFNLANNVKVTWKEVPGAKYYKVYREGITDKKESREEPVIVTERLVGWDKESGLTNGHAYRYKIVASLTGKGDASGDSPLSYSKVMYRLKTVVIRSVKNTAPGKVTVKYDKTNSGDSYVLQYCEREDMVGAKTKVVLGANNTSYTIGGLKKGKTYYISIRVRKKVNGIDYYTTFGVPKKIRIEK